MKKYTNILLIVAVIVAGVIIALGVFEVFLKVLIPLVVILFVLNIVFSTASRQKNIKSENLKTATAIFSGSDIKLDGELFVGGRFFALFGGIDCDLRTALFEGDCVIDATTIFGGVDIKVPDNIKVKVNSTSVFGGVSQKKKNIADGQNTLYINATCLFGGVDIK